MTHDELLARINEERTFANAEALRTVVELHKPIKESWATECEHCQGIADGLTQEYPCPTIQAIAKEFG